MLSNSILAQSITLDVGLFTPIISAVIAGYAALGGLLVWQLRRQATQTETLTKDFIAALQNTIIENNKTNAMMVERMTELVTTVREMAAVNRDEHRSLIMSQAEQHRALLDAIGKANLRTAA